VKLSHLARLMPSRLSGGPAAARRHRTRHRRRSTDPARRRATGNLDSRHGDAVISCSAACTPAASTVCLVTHNPAYAKIATRTVHMADGRIVEDSRA